MPIQPFVLPQDKSREALDVFGVMKTSDMNPPLPPEDGDAYLDDITHNAEVSP